MTAGFRGISSSPSPVSTPIPSTARKVIHDLKEIINNANVSDEEIYSALRECNMDPNETVQRLLTQDTFHEVKRKRDKKKENASKEVADVRSRVPVIGSSIRGGRSRGRGNYQPRENGSNGRGQSISRRENDLHQNPQAEEVQEQTKGNSSIISGSGIGAITNSHAHDVPNGTSPYHTSVQGSRGGWSIGPGQATMADILKSRNGLQGNANLIANGNTCVPSERVSEWPLDAPDEGTLPSSGDHGAKSYGDLASGDTTGSLPDEPNSHSEKTSQIHHSIKSDHVDLPRELTSPLEMKLHAHASSPQSDSGSAKLSNQGSSGIGSGLEWRPKSPVTSDHDNFEILIKSTSNLRLQEDPPSTIQERLQTPDAGRVFPTFGSFDEGNVNSADGHEDDKEGRAVEGSLPDEAEQSSPTGVKASACTNNDHKNLTPAYVDTLVVKEDAKSKMDASVNIPIAQPEAAIPETAAQKANPYSIPLGMHNPSGPTPIPQIAGNSVALPVAAPTAPPSTIPQQHIGPIHAYPVQQAAVPVTPFGANAFGIHYVPPSYGYIHSPYQHNFAGNTSYPQAPGSSYAFAPAAGANSGAVKYALPQYKPTGASAGMVSHTTGYGNNYGGSSSGFAAVNSAVTSATVSGYGDVSGPQQHKENNLYISRQQHGAEGSGVWIQNTATREMAPIQTNSFYNHLIGQGQHTTFSHTQAMHGIPAVTTYGNLYHHQPQSGSAPAAHQMLSHPQVLSGVVGTQAGAYQPQQHRVQPSWPQNY